MHCKLWTLSDIHWLVCDVQGPRKEGTLWIRIQHTHSQTLIPSPKMAAILAQHLCTAESVSGPGLGPGPNHGLVPVIFGPDYWPQSRSCFFFVPGPVVLWSRSRYQSRGLVIDIFISKMHKKASHMVKSTPPIWFLYAIASLGVLTKEVRIN